MSRVKTGARVKIYDDPFTQTKFIGEATFVGRQPRFDSGANGATHYSGEVRFDDGHEMFAQWVELDRVGSQGREAYERVRAEIIEKMGSGRRGYETEANQ
jgi:hypothetical protein